MTSSPLRVLIVDDERLARHHLRQLIDAIPDVECVGESPNGKSALVALDVSPVDVMLLDIQMPGLDGFEVIKAIPPERIPAIVFVTAFDHYAVKAVDVSATDYLLKPPDPDRLRRALESARERLQSRTFAAEQSRLRDLVERLAGSDRASAELVVRDRGRAIRIATEDIDWMRAEDNYVRIHAKGKSHLIRGTIAGMELELDTDRFVRIHRSIIVNVDRVRELRNSLGGGHAVILDSGEKLPVSRAHRKRMSELFTGRSPHRKVGSPQSV